MLIRLAGFSGMAPSLDPLLLAESMAQSAIDCKLGTGVIKPVHVASTVNTPSKTGTKSKIWLYDDDGTPYWFHWVGADVDVARGPLPSDSYKRIYWTGEGAPKMAPLSVAINGGTGYPVASYNLGLPAPTTPSATATEPAAKIIEAATKANPCVLTITGHGYSDDDVLEIDIDKPDSSNDGGTMWDLDGKVVAISVLDDNHITLNGIDSTNYPAYDGGGTIKYYSDPTTEESRAYVVRYQSAYGEVGPPSSASAVITVTGHSQVTINLPTSPPSGAYNVNALDIFRTNTGTSGTEYQYVASVAIGTASYVDTIESSALGFVLDSTEFLAPNANMKGLIALPFGSLAGFYDNVLCLSVACQPHAWPAACQYSMPDKIVSIAAFGNSILVTTTGAPCVATGNAPGAMSVERFEEGYACVSKRGTVDMGYSVLYPSPIGLMQVGVNGVKMVTDAVCRIDEWKALKPASFHAYAYGGRYFAFNSDGDCFVFDPTNGTFSELSGSNLTGTVTAGHSEPATGNLYLMAGDNIVLFDGGVSSSFTWKSKKFTAPYPLNLAALQVFASGTTTVKVYADGVLKSTSVVTDSKPVRLPGGFRATFWEFELSGSSQVTQVLVATTMSELAQT